MARYHTRRGNRRLVVGVVAAVALVAGAYFFFFYKPADTGGTQLASTNHLVSDRPEVPAAGEPRPGTIERGETPQLPETTKPAVPDTRRVDQLLTAGRQAFDGGDLVSARELLAEAMDLGVSNGEDLQLRADLTRIGQETIFSQRIFENDPYASRYVIKAGDTLGKIAKEHLVSAEFLARINDIQDMNKIRLGQTIKIVEGPFHAEISKSAFALDVYLGTGSSRTFVKRFKVGLGTDGSTPTGEWTVKNKLKNPTYYPPRGGRILPADHPENPLGERWIGLEGVSGEALGQSRYGIHGTIEPESIGANASMGCVRLYNEDVEDLFDYLVVKHSTVTIVK